MDEDHDLRMQLRRLGGPPRGVDEAWAAVQCATTAHRRSVRRRRFAVIAMALAGGILVISFALTRNGPDSTTVATIDNVEEDDDQTPLDEDPPQERPTVPVASTSPDRAVVDERCLDRDPPTFWQEGQDRAGFIFEGSHEDMLRFAGQDYWRRTIDDGRLTEQGLGEAIAVVCYRLMDGALAEDYAWQDGDATNLPAGTELHQLLSGEVTQRLGATLADGTTVIYEALNPVGALTGADAIDLTNVARVEIWDNDRDNLLSIVDDQSEVEDIVSSVASAPTAPVERFGGSKFRLNFVRSDATSSERTLLVNHSQLHPGGVVLDADLVELVLSYVD